MVKIFEFIFGFYLNINKQQRGLLTLSVQTLCVMLLL